MRDRIKVRREMRVTARLAARLNDKFSDCHAGRRTFDTVVSPSLVDTRTHTAYIPGIATHHLNRPTRSPMRPGGKNDRRD